MRPQHPVTPANTPLGDALSLKKAPWTFQGDTLTKDGTIIPFTVPPGHEALEVEGDPIMGADGKVETLRKFFVYDPATVEVLKMPTRGVSDVNERIQMLTSSGFRMVDSRPGQITFARSQ